MPRRRRRRRRTPHATAAAAVTSPPTSVVDSDAGSTSLPSSVCDDYYAQLVEAGLDQAFAVPHVTEPLDLSSGLAHTPNISPSPSMQPPAAQPLLPPSAPAPSPLPTPVPAALLPEAPLPAPVTAQPPAAEAALPKVRPPTAPAPVLASLSPADRVTWELVESQALEAFHFFQTHAIRGTTFACAPMAQPRARLAMHRAAEVLGARTQSHGNGRDRFVVLTWTKDGTFPIGEAAVRMAVRSVLGELFHPPAGARGEKEARRSLRREQKLDQEAFRADLGIDPDLVEELVARQEWDALEVLFEGVPVPGLARRKKKEKKERKERKAMEKARAEELILRGVPPEVVRLREGSGPGQTSRHWGRDGRAGAAMPAQPLAKSNKGFAMLEKMGWREGEGLGAGNEGRTDPLQPAKRSNRAGLGK